MPPRPEHQEIPVASCGPQAHGRSMVAYAATGDDTLRTECLIGSGGYLSVAGADTGIADIWPALRSKAISPPPLTFISISRVSKSAEKTSFIAHRSPKYV